VGGRRTSWMDGRAAASSVSMEATSARSSGLQRGGSGAYAPLTI
jgi:hypothetical protein